jgi:hypothetical protein
MIVLIQVSDGQFLNEMRQPTGDHLAKYGTYGAAAFQQVFHNDIRKHIVRIAVLMISAIFTARLQPAICTTPSTPQPPYPNPPRTSPP